MAIEKEASKATKTTFFFVGLCIIVAVMAITLGMGYLNGAPDAPSSYNVDKVANNTAISTDTTEQYQQQLHDYNTHQAKTAQNQGESFVASLETTQAPVEKQQSTALTPVSVQDSPSQVNPAAQSLDTNEHELMTHFLEDLKKSWEPQKLALAANIGGSEQGAQHDFTSSLTQDVIPAQEVKEAAQKPVPLVFANSKMAAVIDSAIDSDNPQSIVLTHIPAGTLRGLPYQRKEQPLLGMALVFILTKCIIRAKPAMSMPTPLMMRRCNPPCRALLIIAILVALFCQPLPKA